jgi:truncated hemoglobin YjbI
MACMKQAMEDCEVEEGMRRWLLGTLAGTADWMRNREDAPSELPPTR